MFNWHPILATAAGLLAFSSIIPYTKDILHGTTRPNVVTYSLWALLNFITILAQASAGASWSIILLFGDLFAMSIVIVLCLLGHGYKKYGKIEWICTALFVAAIISWQTTNEPLLAIVFAVIADLIAAIPTVVKTYRDPKSEIAGPWFIVAVSAMLGIASTTIFDLPNLLFPFNILLINLIVGTLALRKK
jgi:hypothetical protein